MKLLYVLPALVAASQKPVYYARLGEFCGEADNGDYHACHGDLTCHQKQCVSGHATGHLRGYHSYHKYGYPKYDWPYKYQHPYYSGAESHPFYRGHMAYPHPYMGSQIGALASSSAWASVKLEDYTAEGQPCSGITGLGAGQKPCAPWLACYKHTFSGSSAALTAATTVIPRAAIAKPSWSTWASDAVVQRAPTPKSTWVVARHGRTASRTSDS